jgi:hypothetical protein
MLGPMGSTIISILRVLTPSEIDRYTEDQVVPENAIKIASGAEGFEPDSSSSRSHQSFRNKDEEGKNLESKDYEVEHEAQIIPINASVKIESKPDHIPDNAEPREELSGLAVVGIESKQALKDKENLRLEREDSKKESTSVFILNQRERLKRSQNKLVGQAAILEYQKSATQEMLNSNDDDEDSKVSGASGILINKKHY